MSVPSPFGSREYVTFHLDGEEHLIPKSLVSKSPMINDLILRSHDSHIHIKDIAASTFGDLIHYLQGDRTQLDGERIQRLIEAAHQLELDEAEQQLTQLFKRSQP